MQKYPRITFTPQEIDILESVYKYVGCSQEIKCEDCPLYNGENSLCELHKAQVAVGRALDRAGVTTPKY